MPDGGEVTFRSGWQGAQKVSARVTEKVKTGGHKKMSRFSPILIFIAFWSLGSFAAEEAGEYMLRRLKRLEEKAAAQADEIDELKSELEQLRKADGETEESGEDFFAPPEFKEIGPVTTYRPHVEGIDLKSELEFGYLRERYKLAEGSSETLDSLYTKFRIGAVWHTHEGWEAGAGLVTGWAGESDLADKIDERGLRAGRSRRNIWSGDWPFDSGSIGLDYAYIEHSYDTASLTVGQQYNPFRTSDVLWDQDLRPVGITGQYEFEGAFLTVGWYDLFQRELRDSPDVQMWAGQLGYDRSLDNWDFTVAVGFYRASSGCERVPGVAPGNDAAYKMGTGDLFAKLGTEVKDLRVYGEGQVWRNFRAQRASGSQARYVLDPTSNNTGFMLGVTGEFANARLGYSYSRVEADSFAWTLVDEFTPVNEKGHRLELGYELTEHMGVSGVFRRMREIRGGDRVNTYQFKMNYLF